MLKFFKNNFLGEMPVDQELPNAPKKIYLLAWYSGSGIPQNSLYGLAEYA